MRTAVCFLVLGMFFMPCSWSKDADGVFDKIVIERTPSTVVWGAPLDGGPIRALFIAPRFTLRDAGELALRLDLKYKTAPVWDSHHLGDAKGRLPGFSPEEAAERLRKYLAEPCDLVVLGNVDLSILPDDVLDAIAAKVKAGSGLLLAHCRENVPARFQEFLSGLTPAEGAEDITRGIGESMTPEWPASLGFVKASKCEQGRVVELNYAGGRPYSHFLLPALNDPLKARPEFFDTYLSLVARAARWAAGRAPLNWIAEVLPADVSGPAESEIPPGLPREFIQEMRDATIEPLYHSYQIRLNQPAGRAYDVRVQVREPNRGLNRIYTGLPRLDKGATRYAVDLPIGPGKYFLDLWLLHKKKVVEWHTEPITVTGWPEISDVAWSKGNLLPNDAVTVSLTVRPDFHRPRACSVYARATDGLGRLVAEAREPVSADGGSVHATLNFADLISNLVKAEVFVTDAPGPQFTHWDLDRAAYSHLYLPVRAPRRPAEFSFAIKSSASEEYNVRALTRTLAGLGVDSAVIDGREDTLTGRRFYLAEMNLRSIPELTRYVPETSGNNKAHFPCITDASFRKGEDKKLEENTAAFWAVGTSVYLLGNGNRLAAPGEDVDLAACYLHGFRQRMTEQYGFLDTLNRAWGSQFDAWETVEPSTREDAAKAGRYVRWLDFRRYLDGEFSEAHVKGRTAVRATDVDARAGFRAARGSDACLGYDWWLLASQLDALAIEAGPVEVEMVRSYRPANSYSALCLGSDSLSGAKEYCRWLPWYAALHGMQAVWCTAPFGGADSSEAAVALLPDGRPSSSFIEAVDAVSELKSGLGTLLATATRRPPGIAIYGSQASLYLSQIDPTGCDSRQAEAGFGKLLEHLALQYDFVSYAQAKQGKLLEYALVILPMARALSDEEVAAIRAFNAKGGRVIADVAPGEFDEHGARRGAFPLDDMFGVRHKEASRLGTPCDPLIRLGEGEAQVSETLSAISPDASVECEKAHAAGAAQGPPVWCLQGADKNFTAMLNHPLPSYADGLDKGLQPLVDNKDEETLTRLFGALLEVAGVVGVAQVTPEQGRAFRGECVALRYGEADIVALLAEPDSPHKFLKATIDLDADWWSYNMREGKPLGRSKKFQAKVAPGDALLVSLLPYAVDKLYLATADDVLAGRRLPVKIAVKTNGPTPGTHLVRLTLQGWRAGTPASTPISYYSQNIVCRRGEAQAYIPLALDETPGVYEVVARDILSGVFAQATVNVNGRMSAPARR